MFNYLCLSNTRLHTNKNTVVGGQITREVCLLNTPKLISIVEGNCNLLPRTVAQTSITTGIDSLTL